MTPDVAVVGGGIVGPVAGAPGLFACAGFSGHGFMHAPAIGEVAAALITGEAPPHDVPALSPDRFREEVRRESYAF